jgi:hypothetical protein
MTGAECREDRLEVGRAGRYQRLSLLIAVLRKAAMELVAERCWQQIVMIAPA